jgi:hypothetical protein
VSAGGLGRLFWLNHNLAIRNVSLTGGKSPDNESGSVVAGIGTSFRMDNGTLSGNESEGAALATATISLRNVTVSGNRVLREGQSVISGYLVNLDHATVFANHGIGVGASGNLSLKNSIVAGNGDGNCRESAGIITYEGKNLADDYTCGGLAVMTIANPRLEPLADNGGPGWTHALERTSPAVNTGRSCDVREDQRHALRDPRCDLGAFEASDPTTVTFTIDPNTSVNATTGTAIVTGTVQCTHEDERFDVSVALQQDQVSRRAGTTRVSGAGFTAVACGTTARQWAVVVVPAAGAFQVGAGVAQAQTANASPWIDPASAVGAVKMYYVRR